MTFDTTPAGLKEAGLRVLAVSKYIVTSMVTVGLGLYIKNQRITRQEVMVAMLVAGANLLYVFLQKWLSTAGEPIS